MPLEDPIGVRHWYRDRHVFRFIALAYLPALAALNLLWEAAQLPLYTIWNEASTGAIAFAVLHCTVGDVLIGVATLVISLILCRAGPLGQWSWLRVGSISVALGFGYTMLSEWINTAVRGSWQYSVLMPTLGIEGYRIGVSPLVQWLILPPLALALAWRRMCRGTDRDT